MASISSKISFIIIIFFFLTLLTTQKINAREPQFFNKIPSNNNNLETENQPKAEDPLDKLEQQEPNFIPENQNGGGYGLYGHESGQLPPSTTTTTTTPTTPTNVNTNLPFKNEFVVPKYLPKNYNTEAYVTEAEGYHPAQETNTNNYYNAGIDVDSRNPKQGYPANEGDNYYPKYGGVGYNSHPAQETNTNNYYNAGIDVDSRNPKQNYPATATTAVANEGDNYYPKYGGVSYNSHPAQETNSNNYYDSGIDVDSQNPKQNYPATVTTAVANEGDNYYPKYGGSSYNYNAASEKQGMSDTRFLENGKYFYDLSLEKNDKYPFESTTRFVDQYKKYGSYNGYNNNINNENTYNEQFQDLQDDEGLP